MNIKRRKKLKDLQVRLQEEHDSMTAFLDEFKENVEEIMEEEQEAFDNLLEHFKEAEKGEAMTINIACMENISESIDLTLSEFDTLKDNMSEACAG